MKKALDEARAGESRRMASEGRTPLLKKRARLGREVPRRVAPPNDALPHRTHENDRSLRQHRELILSYFRAQKLLSSGVVESLNNISSGEPKSLRRNPESRIQLLRISYAI
jgi:hypothetical protein